MRKATFITSIYNGERFVEETIKSVLNQSEPDFWYIVRLDACTDGSEEIVRKYAAMDDRMIVLKNKVNYVSDEGIPARKRVYWPKFDSEYVSIVDHDDILHPDFLKTLYSLGKAFHADEVIAGHTLFDDATGKVVRRRIPSDFHIERLEDIGPHFSDLFSSISPRWGKLYATELYDRYYEEVCTYPKEVSTMLDVWQNFSLLAHCERIVGVSQSLYYYRVNQVSQYFPEILNPSRISEATFFFDVERSFLQKINCDTEKNIIRLYHAHRARMLDLVDIVKRSSKMTAVNKIDYLQLILKDQLLSTYRDFAMQKIQPRMQGCMEEIVRAERETTTLWGHYMFRTDYARVNGIRTKDDLQMYLSALLCRENVLSYGLEMLSPELWSKIPALDQEKILAQVRYFSGDANQYPVPNVQAAKEASKELAGQLNAALENEDLDRANALLQELERYTLTDEAGILCRLMLLVKQGKKKEVEKFSDIAQAICPESRPIQEICCKLK